MPRLEFQDIFDREKGKTGLVFGLGPSLGRHMSQIKTFIDKDKERYKIISCNNIDLMTDINFDYWMLAQPADAGNPLHIPIAFNRYNRKGAMLLYGDCLDLTPRDQVESLLKIPYVGFDQRHFYGCLKCGFGEYGDHGKCCRHIIPGRLCIQEELRRYTGHNDQYGAGDTVGIHMVATAVMLGMNPIYVTGIDLDYSNGYVNNNADIPGDNVGYRVELGASVVKDDVIMTRILKDLRIIKDSAEKIGTKIYAMDFNLRINEVFEHKRLITT
jgi:hypothetical protein